MKQHRLFYLIFFALITVLPFNTIAQEATTDLVGFIATDSAINVRNRPGANGAIIASLPANMSVTILDESDDGAWLSVELPDASSGWVSASLLRVVESAIPADLVVITPDNADQLEQITQLVPTISTELIFSPDGRLLATHFWENHIEIYDVRTKILVTSLTQHTGLISRVVFSPDGSELASSSWDGSVKIWDTQTWGVRKELQGHAAGATGVAYSPDGELIATGGNDGLLIIWNVRTGERLHVIEAHTQPMNKIEFSPDGTILATVGSYSDGSLHLWDVATGERIWSKPGIDHFTFSPDGATILVLSRDSGLKIIGIDVETSYQTFAIRNAGSGGTAIDVNPSGTLVTVGRGRSGTFNIADIVNEQIIFTDNSQQRARNVTITAAFSPDGRLIATASDEAVFLWGVHGSD